MDVRICPRCNSPNTDLGQDIWWGDRVYTCRRCNFRSTLFPVITVKKPEEIKKLPLKPLKKGWK